MGGGLLQLVAYGAQDAYLSGNPQITFWKGLYKRHTNFAMEPFRINLTGQANWGVKHSAIIGRHADLLYSTYIEVVMPPGAEVNNAGARLGYNLLKYVELDIGGQLIDRIYGEWMFLWDCLSSDVSQGLKLSKMVGLGQRPTYFNNYELTIPEIDQCQNGRPSLPTVLYIPIPFFYTKNPGAALPLIALQYHEVKLNIQWQDIKFIAADFSQPNVPAPVQAAVYIDYIYLDVEERRRMAQQSHEYLIEQTQFNEEKGITSAQNRIDLTFNHPVKELVWVVQPSEYTDCRLMAEIGSADHLMPFSYNAAPVYEQWLQINGQDRLDKRYGSYYNLVQPYQHHTGSTNPVWHGNWNPAQAVRETANSGVYMYSFALRPEEHQPSGTCNFSRIDTATIVMSISGLSNTLNYDPVDYEPSEGRDDRNIEISNSRPWNVRVYAVNYNILRIMSGMAGLAYSN